MSSPPPARRQSLQRRPPRPPGRRPAMETIDVETEIAAAPAKIYQALSTTAGHRGWWTTDCEVGSKVGDEALFRFDAMGGGAGAITMRFRLDTLAPGQAVEMTCVGEENNPEWRGRRPAVPVCPAAARRTLAKLMSTR